MNHDLNVELRRYVFATAKKVFRGEKENPEAIARTATLLVPTIIETAKREGDLERVYDLGDQALQQCGQLFWVLHPSYSASSNREKPSCFWRHFPNSPKAPNQNELENEAAA